MSFFYLCRCKNNFFIQCFNLSKGLASILEELTKTKSIISIFKGETCRNPLYCLMETIKFFCTDRWFKMLGNTRVQNLRLRNFLPIGLGVIVQTGSVLSQGYRSTLGVCWSTLVVCEDSITAPEGYPLTPYECRSILFFSVDPCVSRGQCEVDFFPSREISTSLLEGFQPTPHWCRTTLTSGAPYSASFSSFELPDMFCSTPCTRMALIVFLAVFELTWRNISCHFTD